MQTVGFVGLGKMGGPVARLIQKAGFPMVVSDVREEAASPFLQDGARFADTGAEVASLCDVTFTALPMPADVETVAVGANGVLEGIKRDAVYVDISTSSPEMVKRLEAQFRQKGAWMLDAPVGAGQPGSDEGVHEVMVGGERHLFERLRPVFAAYGDQIIYTGGIGTASVCKLVHQTIGCGISQAVAEGLTLGVKAGVAPEVVWDCVRRGLVGRMHLMHEGIPQTVFPGQYEPSVFTLALLHKDVGLAAALSRELKVPMPVSALAQQVVMQAMNRGWGNASAYTVTFQLQEEAAGVNLRASGVDPHVTARYISTHAEVE